MSPRSRVLVASVAVTFGVAALLGCLEWLYPLSFSNDDESVYLAAARYIAAGELPWASTLFPRYVSLHGYPHLEPHHSLFTYLLGFAFWLGGAKLAVAKVCVVSICALLAGLLCFLAAQDWTFTSPEWSWQRGVWAAALFTCFPATWIRGGLILIEPLQALVALALVGSLLCPKRWLRVVLAGVLVACLIRVRDDSAIVLPGLLLALWTRGEPGRRYQDPLVALVVAGLALVGMSALVSHGQASSPGMLALLGPVFYSTLYEAADLPGGHWAMQLSVEPLPPLTIGLVLSRIVKTAPQLLPSADVSAIDHVLTAAFFTVALWSGSARRAAWQFLGLGIACFSAFAFTVFFFGQDGVRHLYFLIPLAALLLAGWIREGSRRRKGIALAFLVACAVLGVYQRAARSQRATEIDRVLVAWERILEAQATDTSRVLVARGGFRLASLAWPVKVCAAPWDLTALRYLDAHLPLGRVVLVDRLDPLAAELDRSGGDQGRWHVVEQARLEGHRVRIWERASDSPGESERR